MSPDRTVTSVQRRPAVEPARTPAEAPPADGFALLLRAADRPAAAPAQRRREADGEVEPRRPGARDAGRHAHAEDPRRRPEARAGDAGRPGEPAAREHATGRATSDGAEPAAHAHATGRAPCDGASPMAGPVPAAAAPAPAAETPAAPFAPAAALAAALAAASLPSAAGTPAATPAAPPAVPAAPPAVPAAPPAVPGGEAAALSPEAALAALAPVPAGAPVRELAAAAAPGAPAAAEPVPGRPAEGPAPAAPPEVPAKPAGDASASAPASAPQLPATPPSASQLPADAGRTGETGPGHEQPAAAPTQTAPVVTPPAPPVVPGTQRAASLAQAPRAVAQLIQLASRDGIDHARITLRPAELGGIEIRLQHSAAGVAAQVIADSPEAARLLEQAAADLRRSLERNDVTLLSLDVSTSDEQRAGGSAAGGFDFRGERGEAGTRAFPARTSEAAAEDEPAVIATVELPDGLHVDVLA